jgi:hypothetical protein
MNNADRQALNKKRLQLMHPKVAAKVAAVLLDLEGHNCQPIIDSGVWRKPSEQLAKFRAGLSRVKWSFHNATNKRGTPESLAADITDQRWGWNSPTWFWLMLASSAKAHGLESGIYWGLNQFQRDQITSAIFDEEFTRQPLTIGWDPAHVQIKGIPLLSAKLGARP